MSKKLLIVESPAKAKTIEKYLGKDFFVKSSFGHIRDLEKGDKGVNIENNFEPNYVVSPEKKKVVSDLKQAAKKADEIWLATDEDREGEAISWHLCKVLGLDESSTKRIVFREITKPAIQKAILSPGKVNLDVVDAQQARRILDRLVGFELSGLLWRKVKGGLSAGRVQSVAVKLIVEREREIQKFKPVPYYKVVALFEVINKAGRKVELKAELPSRIELHESARAFVDKCNGATFTISTINKKPLSKKPAPPFTTSTLQQDASRKLYFGVKRTMSVAQRLYEQGFITYMRTDSTSLSNLALGAIADEIKTTYGEQYLKTRQYKSKSAGAQEAHEAIRPTYIDRKNLGADRDQQRLYDLIWKRTVASQMANAQIEKTIVKIDISTVQDAQLEAVGEVLTFDGFLKLYLESTDDDGDQEAKGMLPPLKIGQVLDLQELTATEKYTRPPARYTEASLVKKLEELGIGRPSTYAPTISKIMEEKRGYITKESREGKERGYQVIKLKDNTITEHKDTEITGSTSNRLYASDLGMVVSDFLSKHFDDIMTYSFTADIENRLDSIAHGKEKWREMLKEFYHPFHASVEETTQNASRAKGMRELGIDPESGHTVLAQMTRFGPVIQIGTREEVGEGGKPKFANLRPGQSIETIAFDEAIKLFELPRSLGEYKGHEVVVNSGRFGPYVKYKEMFVSIPRSMDPLKLTKEEAEALVDEKIKETAPVAHYEGKPVTKGKGRFGPYLKWEDFFVNIPRKYDPDNLSLEEINELIAAKIEKEKNRYIHNWTEEKISVENGRWGPFIRFKKKSIKFPKKEDGKRVEAADVADLTLEDVKKIILAEIPDAFPEKGKAKRKTKK